MFRKARGVATRGNRPPARVVSVDVLADGLFNVLVANRKATRVCCPLAAQPIDISILAGKRFAYNLLEKLLHYVDKAQINLKPVRRDGESHRKEATEGR